MMLTYFNHIVGNEPVKQHLARLLEKKTFSHSLLFAGKEGVGKSLFAEAFAKAVLCADDPSGFHRTKLDAAIHPDLRIYRPEGKTGMHSIDSMRQFSEEVYRAPYEAHKKVFIIYDADRMLTYSANALLKTFEEPAPHSLILLVSSSPTSLLSTVLSRCCTFYFSSINEQEMTPFIQNKWQKNAEEAAILAALSNGSIGNAFRLIDRGGDALRQKILAMLAKGKLTSYLELMQCVSEIKKQVESGQQQIEETLRAQLTAALPEEQTSHQQQELEKEVEGAVAMHLANEAHSIFECILSWYRDLHLIQAKGNPEYLLNRDMQKECEQAQQQHKGILPLEKAQKAIAQASLGLERSLPLESCLESLFLQLNLL